MLSLYVRQNRTKVGLKPFTYTKNSGTVARAKSNQGGIETREGVGRRQVRPGQNRTKVGLKPATSTACCCACTGQNRTKVGLKPSPAKRFRDMLPAKSNQGGIETLADTLGGDKALGQNRTKVGLKPQPSAPDSRAKVRQNRTKVGLKPTGSKSLTAAVNAAKSNQGGIETRGNAHVILPCQTGKIEPRWD